MLQKLFEIYDHYDQVLHKVLREASITDGLFGMGDDPRNNPCHMNFYESVEKWVAEFCQTQPDNGSVYEAAKQIIIAAEQKRGDPGFWFLFAAHGFVKSLIPSLTVQQCAELRAFYDENYPRLERMPVQKEVYKLLKKGAGRR